MRKRKRNIESETNLDLHGVKHQDVDILVEEYVLLHTPPFKIITGHSGIMKQLVIEVLDRHKYKYQDGSLHNLGCILVLSE